MAPRFHIRHAIFLLLLLTTAISSHGDLAHPTRRFLSRSSEYQENPELLDLRRQGNLQFRGGHYLDALRTYEAGYRNAVRQGAQRSALRFLNNLGSADYQLLRYRDAIKAYLQARDLAESQADLETLAAICFNLSSLYAQMGEIDAAGESAERGLAIPAAFSAKFQSRLLIQSAAIQIRQNKAAQAIQGLLRAIDAARAQLDVTVEAQAWNELGRALQDSGRLSSAERALVEAFRLRRLNHDERLHFSYEALGELRLLQNDPASALPLFDKAVASATAGRTVNRWRAFYGRGKANLAASRFQAAYSDFGEALRNLRSWRAEVLPADAFRVSSEMELHKVYSAYIELAAQLYRQTGQQRYVIDSFIAAEESRATTLQALWAESGLPNELPADYWESLAALQAAETAQLQNPSNAGAIGRLRLKLTEIEASRVLGQPAASAPAQVETNDFLQRTRHALGADEVFLSFHTGDSETCLWAVTRDSFEFRSLGSDADLHRDIDAFVRAVTQKSESATSLGEQLYSRIFGRLSPAVQRKATWVIAPDGPLFDLPFAALVESSAPTSYLIEGHAIRIVPGISALFRPGRPVSEEFFVGVGDPVYNRADLRWRPAMRPLPIASADRILELPRLIGSAREVQSCANIWREKRERVLLLEGAEANQHNLSRALDQNPSVLHLAAHVLFPAHEAAAGMVALSLQPDSRMELLSATETAGIRAQIGLVVLDGCSSAQGPVLPGSGLMGLTRAWLVAGARAVIATRWAAADQDSGELFSALYRLYFQQRSHGPAGFGRLLREAQLEELRAGGPHAAPAYWAMYFCVETN